MKTRQAAVATDQNHQNQPRSPTPHPRQVYKHASTSPSMNAHTRRNGTGHKSQRFCFWPCASSVIFMKQILRELSACFCKTHTYTHTCSQGYLFDKEEGTYDDRLCRKVQQDKRPVTAVTAVSLHTHPMTVCLCVFIIALEVHEFLCSALDKNMWSGYIILW